MLLPGLCHAGCEIPGSLIPLQSMRSIRSRVMSTKPVLVSSSDATVSRRGFFMKLGILFHGFAAMVLAVPVVGFLLSSVTRGRANGYLSWVPLGRIDEFPEGDTRLATFRNPNVMPTDGKTVDTACWVRRVAGE